MKPKRLLYIASFFFFLSAFVFLPRILAQEPPTQNELQEEFTTSANSTTDTNLQQFGSNVFEIVNRAAIESMALTDTNSTSRYGAGAINSVSKMVAMTYENKPADTQTFVADLLQDAGIAQPAYAQGLGFSSLTPILELWKVFRNIAYVFFVLLMLVVGFAIMFRQNLGSQTAVTVQQALPKIVVALLMVSFSYAIAGLLIDLMYVVMFFLLVVFSASGLIDAKFVDYANGAESILNKNVFTIFFDLIGNGFAISSGDAVGNFVSNALGDNFVTDIVGIASSMLVTLIILVAVLVAMFKTFFAMIKVYVEIVLTIVFSPLILMMGVINSGVAANWIKGLAVNLLVFPVFLVFVLIGYMFMGLNTGTTEGVDVQFNEGGFLPPFVPGRGSATEISMIVGLAIVLLLSEVPAIVGKFKPKGIFDELGGLAMKNAIAGEPGLPVMTGAVGGAYGAGMGLYASRKQPMTARKRIGAMVYGIPQYDPNDPNKEIGRTGGVMPRFSDAYGVGQGVRKTLDDARDGRLFQPDNFRAQLDKVIKGQEKPSATTDPKVKPKG